MLSVKIVLYNNYKTNSNLFLSQAEKIFHLIKVSCQNLFSVRQTKIKENLIGFYMNNLLALQFFFSLNAHFCAGNYLGFFWSAHSQGLP